jgi:hypothetical protein
MAAYGHMVRLNGGFGEKIATGRSWPVADRRHPTLTGRSDLKPAAHSAKDASAYRTAATVASVAGANGRFEKARPASLGRALPLGLSESCRSGLKRDERRQ